MTDIDIRRCRTQDEYQQCMDLQRHVWRFSDLDVVPHHVLVVCERTGGMTLGAFSATGDLVGVAVSFLARRHDILCQHSHMVAVKLEWRGRGIGRRLKLAQRDQSLAQGIRLIEWTFDPLQASNAHFNLNTLGAISRTYAVNYYGSDMSSPLHHGLDTDRLVVEWWLGSERVVRCISGEGVLRPEPAATVHIPSDIHALKTANLEAARTRQLEVRSRLMECFASGLHVEGIEPVADGTSWRYLLYGDGECASNGSN